MKRKPAEDRKADIVAAVLVLADRIGPDRLTTNDVAREVGVTQAAIFRHFLTKDELWAAVAETIRGRLTEAWDELPADPGPRDRLRALIGAQLRLIETVPALPAILHSRELSVSNAALRETCHGLMLDFRDRLAGCLSEMAGEGTLRRGLGAEDGAMLLISLVQGLAIRWTLGARNFSLADEGLRLFEVQLALFQGSVNDGGQPR